MKVKLDIYFWFMKLSSKIYNTFPIFRIEIIGHTTFTAVEIQRLVSVKCVCPLSVFLKIFYCFFPLRIEEEICIQPISSGHYFRYVEQMQSFVFFVSFINVHREFLSIGIVKQ